MNELNEHNIVQLYQIHNFTNERFPLTESIDIQRLDSIQVDDEVIKITGNSNNGRITGSVINGDSPHGEAWIKIDGNNFEINGLVGNGRPRHGFLVRKRNHKFKKKLDLN